MLCLINNSGFRSSWKQAGADTIAAWGQEARDGQENAHKYMDFDIAQVSWTDQIQCLMQNTILHK